MKRTPFIILLFTIAMIFVGYYALKANIQNKRFAIILQAGKETHEGMARATHALLYATELKGKGYEVVLIFDGAGTVWAEGEHSRFFVTRHFSKMKREYRSQRSEIRVFRGLLTSDFCLLSSDE